MKINSRRFLIASLAMIVMMVAILFSAVTISSLVAHAASGTGTENDPYVVTTYAELRDLMANAPTDGTTRYIKLGGDITSSDSNNDYALTLTNANQNVVLDLAGYTISRSPSVTLDETIVRAKEGTLTINDSVGTGGISSNNNYINSVIGLMADGLYNDNGTIIINGGTYTVDVSSSITSYAVYQARGNLVINGGKFTGGYGLDSVSGNLTVYGGEFYTTKYAAILLASITNGNLYNLTAYGDVRAQSGYNLWNFIHDDGEVFVDGVKQAKTETTKFSGNKIVIKTDVLDEIWITATAPVVGNSIPNSIDVPYTSDYEIVEEYGNQVIAWMVDGQPVSTDTFAASTAYTLRVYVKVNAPTAFDFGAKVNGQPASLEFEVETMEGYKYYWMEYTFPATIDNMIPSANVTVTAPVAGETATGGKIFNSEKYNVSIGWSTTADGSAANDFNNQTFVAGNTYYVDVYLVAENPYIFADGATVFVNGTSYTSVWTIGADYKKYVAVYDIPFTVPNAETYTVSFNANGGTGSMPDETDQLGGLALPECGFTAPAGKQFKCWAEGSASGDQYAPNEEYDVTGDVTFYAVWEELPTFIVAYGPGDGNGSTDFDYIYEGATITLLAPADLGFTAQEGMRFAHWKVCKDNASDPNFVVKQPGDQITITFETYIIAVWEEIPHECVGVLQSGQAATCTVNGWKDYYQCSCGKNYEDANCTKLISDLEAWKVGEGKIVAEHTYGDLIDENPAVHTQTELQAGMRAHYHCSVCGTYFDSSKNETTVIALTIPAPTHSFGDWIKDNEKHWKVCSCGLKADEHTHNYTDSADMICNDCEYDRTVPHTCGNGTKQDGKAATCTENGWNDYFKCSCGKIYTDAACTNEITSLEAWKNGDGKIAASHSYGDLVAKVDATCSQTGMEAHYECSVCHTLFDENKAVKTANELTIDIDANAHTYGAWTSNGDGTHTRVCGINANHKETVACSGGTATCTEKAVCEVCNTPYGNTAAHQHGSEWHNNADEHWNECACGDKANTAPHADEDKDGKCDVCDYAMGNAENPGENIESEKTGLSGGAIAGIAVGSVAGAAALGCGGFAIFWFVIKKKKFADLIALFKKK